MFPASSPFSYRIGRANTFASGVLITSNAQFNFIGISANLSTLQLVSIGNDLYLNFTTMPVLFMGLLFYFALRRRKMPGGRASDG